MAKMNLKNYEKSTTVRRLRPDDFESIVALQRRCFPGMEPWTKEQFDSQLEIFPEGQFCVEHQGRLVASASS
ncbi:MAG: carbon-nitrogen hydrolase, partial [Acidobacteriota bacterium]